MVKDWSHLEGKLLIAVVWDVRKQKGRDGRVWTVAEADLIDAHTGEIYARVEEFLGMLGKSLGELPDIHNRWYAGRIVQRVSGAGNIFAVFEESYSSEDNAIAGKTYTRLAKADEAAAQADEDTREMQKLEAQIAEVKSVFRERERVYGKEAADRSRERYERTGILLWNPDKD